MPFHALYEGLEMQVFIAGLLPLDGELPLQWVVN